MSQTTLPPGMLPADPAAAAAGLSADAFGTALLETLSAHGAPMAVKLVATGRLVQANAPLAALFDRSPEHLLGHSDTELFGPDAAAALREAEQSALTLAAPLVSEHKIEIRGQRRDFSVARVACGVPPSHIVSVWIETTQAQQQAVHLQQALAQIEQHQAAEAQRREPAEPGLRDEVTGLYQRGQFDDLLRREVDLSSREHREFALASIEIDPFSDAVRALGAPAVERVLESLGRLLRGNTRAMDASCRLDDRRFAVLLSGVGLATAHSRMESMRRQCATQIVVLDGRELGFSVSMGVASFPHTAHTQDDLMQAAHAALAEARRRGGNHVALASIRLADL